MVMTLCEFHQLVIRLVWFKKKGGICHTQDLQIFVVVCSLKGYHNNIQTNVWGKIYVVYNGVINFNEKVKIDIVDPVNNQNPISDFFSKSALL